MLENLTQQERQKIVSLGRECSVSAGDVIIEEGAEGTSFYLLLSGRVDVSKKGVTIAEVGKGAILGEMCLFNDNVRVSGLIPLN